MRHSRFQLWYGRDAAPSEVHDLQAGRVTAQFDGTNLRRVRVDGVELAQRIYVAVRDSAWNTIPGSYADVAIESSSDRFRIGFTVHHQYEDIDFTWRGSITGGPDGTIIYALDGIAHADFRYNKIGFNIHHPLHEYVGKAYRARAPHGTIDGVLPHLIEPQRVDNNGYLTAMFPAYDSLSVSLDGGVEVRFDFEGDLFEMQDHRNWADGNYKTYGTPLAIPIPMEAHSGQVFHQKVTISVVRTLVAPAGEAAELHVDLGRPTDCTLPSIGVGMAGHGAPLSAREAQLLRALHLDHVRVDLHLTDPSYSDTLRRGIQTCDALGAQLELALFVNDNTDAKVMECAALVTAMHAPVARVLVFQEAATRSPVAGSTPVRLIRRVRQYLANVAPGVIFAGGTDGFFAELNRDRPEIEALDAVSYSTNPQVHACDDITLVENVEAQAHTVETARSFCGNRPILISPVTLIGRYGPWAAGPPEPGGLPPQVDVRQASLFGAGWTVGSLKYLAQSGVASVTYYETTGWLGLIETDAGSPMSDRFPSHPGVAFPLYHIFADLAEWKTGYLMTLRSSDPLTTEGLALQCGTALHLLVTNMTSRHQAVVVRPLETNRAWVRCLDENTAQIAMTEPQRFRTIGTVEEVRNGELQLNLPPYAVVRIDADIKLYMDKCCQVTLTEDHEDAI